MRTARAALVLVLIVQATTSLAQDVNGNLEGQLLDVEEKPVAYANVLVTNNGLQTTRGTISDKAGFFRIVELPVGSYSVNVSHIGYQQTTLDSVIVRLGTTTNIPGIRLTVRVHETPKVVIVANRPQIDVSSTTLSTNIPSRTFETLPIDRSLGSILELAPQVNASYFGDKANISGATGAENIYYADGIHITEPSVGATSAIDLPYNYIREVRIKTGGYQAENGRAFGGNINIITQSGNNQFHGQLFGFLTNDKLAKTARRTLEESKTNQLSQYDFGGSFSGPIARDRLWFFVAYNPTFDNAETEVPNFGFQDDTTLGHRFAGKLSWHASPRTDLDFTVLGDPSQKDGIGNTLGAAFSGTPHSLENLDPVLQKTQGGGLAFSIQARHRLGRVVLLEASASHVRARGEVTPATSLGKSEPLFSDVRTGTWSGGYGGWFSATGRRLSGKLAATISLPSHLLKAGFEYEDNSMELEQYTGGGQGGGGYITQVDDTTYTWIQSFSPTATTLNRVPSAFIQDSWQPTRNLRINFGVRWEGQYVEDAFGEDFISISNQWQPRLGFTYQHGDRGMNKFFGSVGRFYEQLEAQVAGARPGEFYVLEYDHDPRINPGGADTTDAWIITEADENDVQGGGYFDEFALGYEHQLRGLVKVTLRGVYRRLGRAIEDSYVPEVGWWVLGNPGEGVLDFMEKPRRDYGALELSLKNSDLGSNQFLFSYVLSRNVGNYPGILASDVRATLPNGRQYLTYDFPEQLINGTGLLPNDRTHVLKFFGSHRFGFGLTAGTSLSWQSGTPLSEYGAVQHPAAWPSHWSFLQERGAAGRMPNLVDLNFRFTYALRKSRGSSLAPRLILDLMHVLNRRTAVDFDQKHFFSVDENGEQTNENPFYMQPILYQPPMSARLGMSLDF